ncbi:MAG: hypothetical protein MJ193_04880, partial [Clostridia bacterium]|nr:hypothetical protein [Clostridia bacterium]
VTSTEIYGMIDVIFGERQDALKITLGSEWLAKFEDLMHDAGIVNQHRSTAEIRATNATETYQILLYKTRNTQKYDGVAIRIYDFEIAVVVDREEFMLKFDARRFGFPLNIDIDIHPYDITDLRFIITYDDGFRINFVSDSEELNGNISFGDFVFTAFREHKTGEWDYRLKFNKHTTKPNSDGTYPYYAAGFISKDEDIDFLLGVFNREDKTDSWLARLFDIDSQREIIKFNYDKIDKVFKLDFTLLQIGSASINISTMMSEAEYSFAFNVMGELDDDYVHETAGKNSIEILNILTVSGNRQTGAISVYFIASLVEEQLAFRFMYDPFGDNGFTIYRYDPTNFDGYKGDYMDDMEYISVIYNLNNYTMRVVIKGYFEAIVELDDDDPTIRNAHLWISIINL